MNCPLEAGNAEVLLDYAAGKLKAGARAQMDRHVESCNACKQFAGAQATLWQALDKWEPAEVSMDFDRRLYARIEQNVSWWTRLMRPLNPLFRHSMPIAAAAGVVIMAGLLLNRPAAVPVARRRNPHKWNRYSRTSCRARSTTWRCCASSINWFPITPAPRCRLP